MAEIDAARARALVGVPFRAQGRDIRMGLDCVGLALAACGAAGSGVRRDYQLRGDHRAEIEAWLSHGFRRVNNDERRPGDLVLMRVAKDQMHLGILTDRGFVHADARRRRAVETPGEPEWPLLGIYRRNLSGRDF